MQNSLRTWIVTVLVAVTFVAVVPVSTFAAHPKPNVDMNDLSYYQGPTSLEPYPTVPARSVRNVIFMIGDGMGLSQVTLARLMAVGSQGKLNLERMPISGLVRTHSADNLVTDSAASGTALATGIKTKNGMIGMAPDRTEYRTILEAAKAKGMATGLVVTSTMSHATPASFASHVRDRGSEADIAGQLLANHVDVLFGGGRKYFLPKSARDSGRKDNEDLIAQAKEAGYTYIQTGDQLSTVHDLPVLGLFQMDGLTTGPGEPSLATMTAKAIRLLRDDRKGWFIKQRGFFMMVEGSQIDWACHDNDAIHAVWQTLHFDQAVKAAIDFALADGHTLVVVTADHETGGMTIPSGKLDGSNVKVKWSTTGHTGTPVPIYAFGPGAEQFEGIFDNTQVSAKIADLLHIKPWPQPAK